MTGIKLVNLPDEKIIEEYKGFYQKLRAFENRVSVLTTLRDFLNKFYPYIKQLEKQEYFSDYEFRKLTFDIDSFIKRTFSPDIYNIFSNPPVVEKKGPSGEQLGDYALYIIEQVQELKRRYSIQKISDHVFQYNLLFKIYSCLNDFGLHSKIENRDPKLYMRYNVLVEHQIDRKNTGIECMTLISVDKLLQSFVEPYHSEKPISINGVKIYAKNIRRITITTTLLKDDEILNFMSKHKNKTPVDFAKSCKNETNRLLDEMQAVSDTAKEKREVPFIGQLMSNLNISRVVLDTYHSLVTQPLSKENISQSYTGPLNRYNPPFQVKIFGAYPLMRDWELVDHKINSGYFSEHSISKTEIDEYLKKYGAEFNNGYYSFENDILNKKTAIFNEVEDRRQVIFDYATGSLFKGSGFPEARGKQRHLLSAWPQAGKEAGYFYRAWYIILENSKRFEPLFINTQSLEIDQFLESFITGIAELQKMDSAETFIRALKDGTKKEEFGFRNWFRTFFKGAGYDYVEAEPLKGSGRIDLKIEDKKVGKKIIEFKGWWNKDIDNIADQLWGYLTDFEDSGYILLINHLKTKDISDSYEQKITNKKTGYIRGTWKSLHYKNTNFTFFISKHKLGNKVKTLYHLVYRLYP